MSSRPGETNVIKHMNVPAGATLTDLDFQYVYPTDTPELLEIHFPDAAFATGADEVILKVYNPADGWQRDYKAELMEAFNE